MKKILGLDLGTTSIGWAFVKEAESSDEKSSIERVGVRVNPLSTDEQTNFEKGKPISVNEDRTLKRGARRNLQRFKLRRENLIEILLSTKIINLEIPLAENEKQSTHSTYKLRAKAATEKINMEEFARVLLMINKKRGYKSSRKAKNEDEGSIIDGMAVAKKLYDENITPGELCYSLLKEGKKYLPDFYRSDLNNELDKIWNYQKQFHQEILTDDFRKLIDGKGQRATSAIFWTTFKFNVAEIKGTREEKKLIASEWRSIAFKQELTKEQLAYVITEINNNINNSSGYLGAISDRSKELYFNKETIGQYLYRSLKNNFHSRTKNQVFYRQDYLDEFETIWETQAQFYSELTKELKIEIRDVIIFYQRKLKSQKGLVAFCELESKEIESLENGKLVKRTIGYKVTPKSSPLFQEFKIWQNLGHLLAKNKETKEESRFDLEAKMELFNHLNIKGNLSKNDVLKILGYKNQEWELNYKILEGNRTNFALFETYFKMMELEGHEEIDWLNKNPNEIISILKIFFESQNINIEILKFDSELEGKSFEKQLSYQLWHLLHSYEEDNSNSGNEKLYSLLLSKFGFKLEFAKLLANISLSQDYGSLSAKAIRKIFPFIRESNFSEACEMAKYNHSSSLTKVENDNRILNDKLEILAKNSLRNPVVEKILNQMVNVVNTIINDPQLGKPDEIRIELARELKKNNKEREEMTSQINKAKDNHDNIRKILINEDGILNPTRNDIIRYKLYQELKNNGYKTIYSNTYVPREKLFTKEFDIEHILPKAKLFDDSFSNKTLCLRQENLDKRDRCAIDFVEDYFGKDIMPDYLSRVEMLFQINQKNPEEGINKAKYKKLLLRETELGKGFIERDLRDTQYIAKKAKQMLLSISRTVVSTSGGVTDRLREDWDLVNVMQELNFDKYKKLGLTETIIKKDGSFKERIIDWTKRNDHRHHAMDALTIAFTKHSHIQYLNNLNARRKEDKLGKEIYAIEQKETYISIDEDGNKKRKFKLPIVNFRTESKAHLENILVSSKAKNKVVTKNKNTFKTASGLKSVIELTPRGQLHKETVYGKINRYVTKEEKVGAKFTLEIILQVSKSKIREALLNRLKEFDNDAKKAFTGKNTLEKNPIYLDANKTIKVPEKVKLVWFENDFTIRKEITPELKIDKVIDVGIRNILQNRLNEFDGNTKEAFSNLEKNPIWQNKSKGITLKRVSISGVKSANSLHTKKDILGKDILDKNGDNIPVDFISTGNNHHVAIYKDSEGNLQDNVISFFEAVERARQNLPIIDKVYNAHLGWQFLFTMKQNEYFVFPSNDFNPNEVDLMDPRNNSTISPNLFRVQTLSIVKYGNNTIRDFKFRHHLETSVEDKKELKDFAYKQYKTILPLENVCKVRINHIGQIVKVGEY